MTDDTTTGVAWLLAILVLLWAACYDPLATSIPDDIPGSEPDDGILFGEVEPRKGPTDE